MLKTPQPTPPDSLKQAHVSNDIIVSIPPISIPSDDPPQSQKEEEKLTKQDLLKYVVPLYQAALDGDWDKAEIVFKVDNKWMTAKITKHGDTILHIAAAAMHLDFVKKLASRMHKNNVPLDSKNVHGNTAFCNAASSGNVEIAQVMVGFDKELPNIRSSGAKKLTPLHMAILLGKRDMVNYLNNDSVTDPKKLTDEDRIELLTSAIEAGLYDIALDFIQKYPCLALQRNSKDETVLHTLAAQRPLKNSTHKQNIWGKLLRRCKNTRNKENEQDLKNNALEVTRKAWQKVVEKEDISEHINTPWRLLFVAAKRGNVDFLRTLIYIYPDIIWKVDEKGRSIFHIAVQYRHEEIFKLIHEFGTIKDLIATYMDDHGNNMLHLAAKLPPPDRLNCISGAALQMQRELLWFEAVRKVVQPQYALANNHDDITYEDDDISDFGMTPQALFTKQHEDLRSRGEAWMKKTAESCTLVATLITTVIFTAAFTLPGGNDQNNGSPILLNQVCFKIFAIFNAVALFASSTSIFIFLSILTSRYAEKDFLVALPRKLMAGLTSLFFSIVFMMAAFTATFFITFLRNPIWIPAPIPVLAAIPVVLFLYQQSSLLWDIYSSKNKSWTLIQPSDKRTLFWSSKSPKIMSNKEEKTSYRRLHNKLE
ncbi:ankyrin repeat, PH and SEC7 domain containing protein secG-like [Chenopodium quinoa]|uniref:ankyrin repeat, PH and SEC7 domain containing protein secG-like n=1 Tax=Chenopodium quinoa TaxID=63459 RepID=UPI000B778090|nr:ankyrin repeat, PH and SEC7 domain containing protein secG-like [Chenopodium quinoa]